MTIGEDWPKRRHRALGPFPTAWLRATAGCRVVVQLGITGTAYICICIGIGIGIDRGIIPMLCSHIII